MHILMLHSRTKTVFQRKMLFIYSLLLFLVYFVTIVNLVFNAELFRLEIAQTHIHVIVFMERNEKKMYSLTAL